MESNKSLTKRQQQILDFIKSEIKEKGYPPTVREIGKAVGLSSSSTVYTHLTNLEKKNYIKRDSTKPRAIEIVGADDEFYKRNVAYVSVVGEVTAGQPILAVENIEDRFPLPADMVDNGTYFMLKVKGESMINAGIYDSDLVLVKKQSSAINGDIVVALVGDDSATVKTFYRESSRIRLQPENDTMNPIYSSQVEILGLVKGVFRYFN